MPMAKFVGNYLIRGYLSGYVQYGPYDYHVWIVACNSCERIFDYDAIEFLLYE